MAKSKRSWGPSNPLWRWQHRKSSSTKRGQNNVARKRRTGRRSRGRSFMSSAAKPLTILLSAGLYGAGRQKLSDAVAPLTSKIPLGAISDEVGLFALHYFANKMFKNKLVSQITQSGMAVEAALIGAEVAKGNVSLTGSQSAVSNGNIF